ncbi:TonB-dependent receptor plug domain-containing protein [Pelagicoccus mobilis]|uniref:TonB-dependent receptor plug domain-containing protein n=1 Tax=Pelagicoccus mobilis TaxID=415221 RepID=A0A934VPG6_9BACT|nr:TonB-dependent receptor plug domain-containing protein [Pelagicoccus mobilis]MBK1877267.1 TonB-dependent receptor plug domain-containing protein [Pelagicoccus mobilis]
MRHKLRQIDLSSLSKWSLLTAGFMSALPLAVAQSADDEEEIFELSPFTVDGSQDEGYRATQTLAGGRLATNLKDIGTSVEVLTKEFLEDVGANDVQEFLQYTTGGEVGGSQGNIEGAAEGGSGGEVSSAGTRAEPHANTRLRGIGAPDTVRNYYKTGIPIDTYNTNRIDINRGANSFLFGLGQPAGLINSNYVQAEMRDQGKIEFQIGSGGNSPSFRTNIDFNKVLIDDKLAIRFATLNDRMEYRQRPSYRDTDRFYVAAKFKPTESTTLRAHIEEGDIMGNAPDTLLPTQAFDTFIQYRTPIDFFDNMQRFGDEEGPSQAQWEALSPEEQAQYVNLGAVPEKLFNNGSIWGYAFVHDGANGADPSFGMRPQVPNAGYENGNADEGIPGDPFWSPDGSAGGSPSMIFWRNKRNGAETNGGGPAQGFTSLDGFDFSKQNFGGNSDYYSHDFNTYNITFEQLFWDGQAGIEIGYDHETKDDDAQNNFNGWGGEFLIDINKTIPLPYVDENGYAQTDADGNVISMVRENPNYGRPLYVTTPSRRLVESEKETWRATAFVKYDFTDKHSDSFLKWLGKHTLTGLFDEHTDKWKYTSLRQQTYSDDFNIGWHLSNRDSDAPWHNYRAAANMVYLGPALQSYINDPFNPNTNININDIIINPSMANLLADNPSLPVTFWSLGPDAEGANWTHISNPDYVNNHLEPGNHDMVYEPAEDDPENPYFGDRSEYWDPGVLEGRWTVNGAQARETIIESHAVNLQSMFFNNHLVANLGYREDVVKNWSLGIPLEYQDISEEFAGNRQYAVEPEYFQARDGAYSEIDKGPTGDGSFGYGGVFHLPKDFLFFETPRNVDFRIHYNSSENFVPDASRFTYNAAGGGYEPLASPIGEGEDFGFTIDFNNKFVARFNWYETSVQNATASGMGAAANGLVRWALHTRYWAIQDLNTLDPDRNGVLDVDANGNPLPKWRLNQTWWDPSRLVTVVDATQWAVDEGWEQAKIDAGVLTFRPNGTAQKHGWLPNLQDSESRTSKGMEMNFTYNPTRQWRVALNIAKIESVSSDVAPMTTHILDNFFESYNEIKDFKLWDAADTRDHSAPFSNWFQNMINNYWVKKLQEGSTTAETRKWSGSVVTNYRFTDGRFKGFSMGGAVRYRGEGAIGYPLMDYDVSEDVTLRVPDVSKPYMSSSNVNVDFNAGYRTKIFEDKVTWDLRLHLKNLNNLSNDGLTTIRANYDGTAATVRWDPPFTARLTSSFRF